MPTASAETKPPPAPTVADIVARQAELRAFVATEAGKLLYRFKNAHSNAVVVDGMEAVSDKRLRDVWAASDAAGALLEAEIKRLQSSNADLLLTLRAIANGNVITTSDFEGALAEVRSMAHEAITKAEG